jgi:hypothetical protein
MSIIVTNDVLEVSVSNETLVVEISSVGSKGEDGAVGIPLTHGVTPPSNEDGMPDGAMYVAYDDETASPIELYEGPPGPPGPPGLKGDPGSDATVTEENITAALGGAAIIEDDPRLTDSREWTADTVDQPEAESGTATTRRAWTAQRVRQAIAAWWASVTNIDGKTIGATTPAAGSFTTAKLASTLAAPNSLERPAKVWIGGVKSSTDMVNIPRLSFVPNTNVNSNGAYGGELLFQSNQSNPEHGSGIRAKQDSTDIRRNNVELFTSYFVSGTRDEKALTRLRVDSTGSTTFTPDGVNAVGVFSSTGLSVTGTLSASGVATFTGGIARVQATNGSLQFFKDATPTKAARVSFNGAAAADGLQFDIYNGATWNTAFSVSAAGALSATGALTTAGIKENAAGNVGIGTTTMLSNAWNRVAVASANSATTYASQLPAMLTMKNTNSTAGNYSLIGIADPLAETNTVAFGGINVTPNASGSACVGAFTVATKASGSTTLTERLRIDSAGNVGIGTTSITERLTVSGNVAISGSITEAALPVVTQSDIGTAPNEIPLNQFLGGMAYMNPDQVVIHPQASVTPATVGGMVFELTSDTSLTVKVRGSDGVVRSAVLTLA